VTGIHQIYFIRGDFSAIDTECDDGRGPCISNGGYEYSKH
jgi:hypothetical protein